MIIINLILFTIQTFLWILFLSVIVGLIRLFVVGYKERYPNPLTDISVLKNGDIILTGKQSVTYSWYIQLSNVMTRKIKHRFWTHAAMYRGNGLLWEAQPQGIIERPIQDYMKDGYIVRAFRHKYLIDEKVIDNAVQFCADQKGCKYGTRALIFYVFSTFTPSSFNYLFENPFINKICNLDKAYFCSELVADAFETAGYPVSPYDGWRVKPSDFISNPLLEPV